MSPSIYEPLINMPNSQIPGLELHELEVASRNVSEYSYRINEPVENRLFDNQSMSLNWSLSSFNPGFIDATTISLSFIQNQPHGQDINFEVTFLSKYEPVREILNIYGIVFDGKTHLDSVAEGVIEAILAALESFVKAVTELVSKLFNFIWDLINKILEPLIKPLKDAAGRFILSLCNGFNNLLLIQPGKGRQEKNAPDPIIASAFTVNVIGPFLNLAIGFNVLVFTLFAITTIMAGPAKIPITTAIKNYLVKQIKEKFAKDEFKKQLKLAVGAALVGFILGWFVNAEELWQKLTAVGLGILVPVIVTCIQYYLWVQQEKIWFDMPFGNTLKRILKDWDTFALIISILAAFISLFASEFIESLLGGGALSNSFKLVISIIALIFGFIGAFIGVTKAGFNDELDFPWDFLDELVDIGAFFVDSAQLIKDAMKIY